MGKLSFDFKSIELDNIASWPAAFSRLVIIVVGIIVFIIGFIFIDRPQYSSISQMKESEITAKQSLQILVPQVVKLNFDKEQLKNLEKILETHADKLPSATHLEIAMDDLTKLSAKNQLKLLLLKPKNVKKSYPYEKIPININVVGSYKQIVKFLEEVSLLNYYLYLSEVNITLNNKFDPDNKEQVFTGDLLMQATIYIFYLSNDKPEETKK